VKLNTILCKNSVFTKKQAQNKIRLVQNLENPPSTKLAAFCLPLRCSHEWNFQAFISTTAFHPRESQKHGSPACPMLHKTWHDSETPQGGYDISAIVKLQKPSTPLGVSGTTKLPCWWASIPNCTAPESSE